jgi:hypothetical protein
MSEENNSKEELEGELLEIRKEIQWREREQDQNRETSHRWFISGIIILLFVLSFIIFGKDE